MQTSCRPRGRPYKKFEFTPEHRARYERLCADYLPFAQMLAKKVHRRTNVDLDAIESAAMLGLMQAARRFKPEMGFQFATLAGRVILKKCWEAVADHNKRHSMAGLRVHGLSDIDHQTLAGRETRPDLALIQKEVREQCAEWVKTQLATLEPRERDVITSRLLGEKVTLQEIAVRHGVKKQRIHQIQKSVERQLRTARKRHPVDFD